MSERRPADPADARVRNLTSAIDTTMAADATIGRTTFEPVPMGALPLLSIDGSTDAATTGGNADLRVTGLLGAGGMGAVYAARQHALDRDVAIKRPLSEDPSPQTRAALVGEARVMGALEHPNIVPVHALGCDRDGLPVLVMKRVEGVVWRELLLSPGHPMWTRLGASRGRGLRFHVDVLMRVCDALQFAHSRGVVHRDVKPENVMIGAFGEVYLLDWGVARPKSAPRSSQVVGTPAYMAPEMLADPAAVDERSDVYLLGATLHEVLVGEPLHQGATLDEVLRSVLLHEPFAYSDAIPPDLVALCSMATSPDPKHRPATCEAFRDALAAYVAHRASHELAASALSKLDEVARRLAEDAASLERPEMGILLAECRFGLDQSLREWSANDLARAGLQRCLERGVARELRLRNAAAATALMTALPEPCPELAAQLAELERALEAARTLEAAHTLQARELDASVSARPRFVFLGAFLVLGVTLSLAAYIDERHTHALMPMTDQVMLDVTLLAFVLVGLGIGRRRLLANAFNRNIWALWIITMVGILGVDTFFLVRGIDAATATAIDFALLAAVFAGGAVTFSRHLGWVALTSGSAAILAAFFPRQSTPIATLALILSLGIIMENTRTSAAK